MTLPASTERAARARTDWPPPRLRWAGPGMAAFVGASAARALEEHRSAGGRAARTFGDTLFGLEGDAVERPGRDGGPGGGTGLDAALDFEDVGTVAISGPLPPARARDVLAIAGRVPDLLFLFEARADALGESGAAGEAPEAAGAEGPAFRLLRPNAAALVSPGGLPAEGGARPEALEPGLGALVAYLESRDFRPEPPYAPPSAERPAWLSPEDALYLEAFRRLQGLRRSLEEGTRWVLFERNGPLLWGALEREIGSFLGRLREAGLLEPEASGGSFRVRCGPLGAEGSPAEAGGAGADLLSVDAQETGVSIRVWARLARPYGPALARRERGFEGGRAPSREPGGLGRGGT